MTMRTILTVAMIELAVTTVASAFPNYSRNCSDCHTSAPPAAGTPEVVGFDGFADPIETTPGATDRGLLKVFTVSPGDTVDLSVRVDLGAAQGTVFAVELKRPEVPGVVNGGQLSYLADANWFMQTGVVDNNPSAPYYTIPELSGQLYVQPEVFTFSMLVDPSTPPDFYDLEFAMAGQPDFFYGDEHFYLEVVPEPGVCGLVLLGSSVLLWRRRRSARRGA